MSPKQKDGTAITSNRFFFFKTRLNENSTIKKGRKKLSYCKISLARGLFQMVIAMGYFNTRRDLYALWNRGIGKYLPSDKLRLYKAPC